MDSTMETTSTTIMILSALSTYSNMILLIIMYSIFEHVVNSTTEKGMECCRVAPSSC